MLTETELIALNQAMEQINNEFCERFDRFNTRYPIFYKKFDSLESFEVTLDYLPGTGAIVRFLGVIIFRSVDDMPDRDLTDEDELAVLSAWFYEYLTDKISYAAQYASMLTKDGTTVCEAVNERRRQDLKWGTQNHPWTRDDFLYEDYRDLRMHNVREIFQQVHDCEHTPITWMDILVEEVAEAAEAAELKDSEALYEELVQVAAVALQWAEKVKPK